MDDFVSPAKLACTSMSLDCERKEEKLYIHDERQTHTTKLRTSTDAKTDLFLLPQLHVCLISHRRTPSDCTVWKTPWGSHLVVQKISVQVMFMTPLSPNSMFLFLLQGTIWSEHLHSFPDHETFHEMKGIGTVLFQSAVLTVPPADGSLFLGGLKSCTQKSFFLLLISADSAL